MANLNKVLLIGRLTRDPELKYTPGGTGVCEIGLAVSDWWKGKDGQRQEETAFIDVTFWGRQAEIVNEHCNKGSEIYVEGKLKFEQWNDNNGNRRSKLKVTAMGMQFVGSRNEQSRPQQQQQSSQGQMAFTPPPEDDIPF